MLHLEPDDFLAVLFPEHLDQSGVSGRALLELVPALVLQTHGGFAVVRLEPVDALVVVGDQRLDPGPVLSGQGPGEVAAVAPEAVHGLAVSAVGVFGQAVLLADAGAERLEILGHDRQRQIEEAHDLLFAADGVRAEEQMKILGFLAFRANPTHRTLLSGVNDLFR